MKDFELTSESVSEGHPDKVADQISDAIVDKSLEVDPNSRIAVETMIAKNLIVIGGEVTTKAFINYPSIIDSVLEKVGYTIGYIGFDAKNYKLQLSITNQSQNIADSVNKPDDQIGAGDQGIMFGYAIKETESLMSFPITLAHQLLIKLSKLRNSGKYDFLLPDAKSQVTIKYLRNKPVGVKKIVISTQHQAFVTSKKLQEVIIEEVIKKTIPEDLEFNISDCLINPSGRFVEGGPLADVGLTGRKIIVDTYGGSCPHGGGAFSGKDASKVDRSGAYMARYIAKNIVAAGLAYKCTVQLAYVIGQTEPVSIFLDFHNTGKVEEEKVLKIIPEIFDLTPSGIINQLNLTRPIFSKTSVYGHFGRNDEDFLWERTDKVDSLLNSLNKF